MSLLAELAYAAEDCRKTEALETVENELISIISSQGWIEALNSNDPGNVTEWIGPRIFKALDATRKALGKTE